jgi:hypothetical protein
MDDSEFYAASLQYFGYFGAVRGAIYGAGFAPGGGIKGGFSLWQFTGGQWELRKHACEEGYEGGEPPREPGAFEGEVRKTPCRPKSPDASTKRP